MDVNFIYYKELPFLDKNIYSTNSSQNNKTEEICFKKSNQDMITNLKINQKTDIIKISDEQLSNAIDAIAQKSKHVSFKCVMDMENLFFTAVEFEKQDDVKNRQLSIKMRNKRKKP